MHARNYVLGIIALSALCSGGCDSPGGGNAFIEPDTAPATQPDAEGEAVAPEIVATETIAAETSDEIVATETIGGETTPTEAGTPRILELATNVTRLTHDQSVVISAIVTDADGIDDLIGGTLRDAAGGTYGSFATSAAEGAYSMTVSWSQMNVMAPITFDDAGARTLIAEFFDQGGHRSAREIVLALHCDGEAACDGQCRALQCGGRCLAPDAHHSDGDNCGRCGNACASGGYCDGGECRCTGDVCDGACRDTWRDVQNCGGCDIACAPGETCSERRCWCDATSCGAGALCVGGRCERVDEGAGGVRLTGGSTSPTFVGGTLEVDLGGQWRKACADSAPETIGAVACHQLGMPLLQAHYQTGVAGTLGVSCDGDETSIGVCSLSDHPCDEALLVLCGTVGFP